MDNPQDCVIVGIVGSIGWQIVMSISAPVNCDLNFALPSGEIYTAFELCCKHVCKTDMADRAMGTPAATFSAYSQF